MALSGSVSTKFYNDNFTVYFDWTATQSASNNRSTVTVKMYLKSNGSLFLSGGTCKCSIRLDGTWYNSTSFNSSLSPSDGKVLKYTFPSVNLTHSSTGTKSFSLLGEVAFTNTNVISGSSNLGSVGYKFTTSSKTFTLNTIARASTLDSFSISSHLKPSTANTVNLSITRKNSSYTHDIELRDGSTVLKTWTGQGTPSTLTIDSSTVNTLLSRMSNTTSRTLTLRVQTKSGSSNIGSAVTRTATATVHNDVKPTATSLSVSISGSGRDKTIGKYVQSISKVYASFTGSATGGASVSSMKIVVRRKSDSGNSQTINSGSGTTANPVALSGTYTAIATVTDSRGRSASTSTDFTVHAYSPPKITSFTAVRNSSTPTTVNIGRYGSWTTLGGDNTLAIVVKRGSTTIQNVTGTGTSGSVSGTLNDTGRSITSSYTYTVTLTDTFGNSASASASVSTQRVVLDIHKNEGVGIGKIHEKGVLDVEGDSYFEGNSYFDGTIRQGNKLVPTVEQGTWTPYFMFDTGNIPSGIGYESQVGRYYRVGNLVYISLYIKTTSFGLSSTAMAIGGLPYVATTVTGQMLAVATTFQNCGSLRVYNNRIQLRTATGTGTVPGYGTGSNTWTYAAGCYLIA